MPTRSEYVTMIWTYQKRREAVKDKYGTGKTRKITKKISQWSKEVRRIDKRNERINSLIESVNYYFSVTIESKVMNAAHKLARKVYYKYSIESGFEGTFASKSIGMSRVHTATEGRRTFTNSFKGNPLNREVYHNFKTYIKNNSDEAI